MNISRFLNHSATPVIATFGLFTLLSVIMTWPLTRYIGGKVQDLGDPLFQIWILRAIQHQLANNPFDLWNGNAAYPFEMSLLFSEPHVSTALLHWPIVALTGNDILGYNLLILATFVTTGAGMALLIRELTGSFGAGIITGSLAAFAPYRFGHMSHLNLLSYGWLLLALWLLVRFARTHRLRDAFGAAVLLTIQFHASDTLAVFSLVAVGITFVALVWHLRLEKNRRFLLVSAAIVVAPLITFLPVILGRLEVNRLYGFERSLDDLRASSASPGDFLAVHPSNHFWADILPTAYPNPLFPGLITVLAAGAGIIFASKNCRPWIFAGSVLVVVGGIMALGPELRLRSLEIPMPYRLMYDHLPGGSSMRDVARFGMLTLMGMHILAGLGIAAILTRIPQQIGGVSRADLKAGAVILVCLVAIVELRTEVGAEEVDRSSERLAAYEWLIGQPAGPVMEFPANGLWVDNRRAISSMYYSTFHWNPIVTVFSTFVPMDHIRFIEAIHRAAEGDSHVTGANLPLLQDLGIEYVLIRHDVDDYDSQRALDEAHQLAGLDYAGTFGDTSVFVIDGNPPTPVSFTLVAPGETVAGQEVQLSVIAWNPRPHGAAIRTPSSEIAFSATWFDSSGQEIATSTRGLGSVLTVSPGATAIPLPVISPQEPGQYQVVLELHGTDTEPEHADVNVIDQPQASDSHAVIIHEIGGIEQVYKPGGWIRVEMSALFQTVPDTPFSVALQLFDSDRVIAQSDTWSFDVAFGGHYPVPRRAFTIPAPLQLPNDIPEGSYELLIAIYQPEEDGWPRLTLEQPGEEQSSTEIVVDVQIQTEP